MNKKLLSILAAVMLLLTLIPVSASAVDTVVNTGITHNWILPVVLICVAVLVIVGLVVTKKKKPDVDSDGDNDNNTDETDNNETDE